MRFLGKVDFRPASEDRGDNQEIPNKFRAERREASARQPE